MPTQFRLRAGDVGPVQQSPVTCGSACLTVARMLLDPVFARWVQDGDPVPPGVPLGGSTPEERFAAYERRVLRRTNGVLGPGNRPHPPWPRALGTPPWGARHELEHGAAKPGTRYDIEMLRAAGPARLGAAFDRLVQVVGDGEPALLYVGSPALPRHVTLVLPDGGNGTLDVYDPANGVVGHLRRDEVVQRRLGLSGWEVAWFSVQPTGLRRAHAFGFATGMSSTSAAARVSPSA